MRYEALIPLLAGIYGTLLGFGVVAPGKDPEKNKMWLKRFGLLMKVAGPALVIYGVIELFGFLR